MTKKTDKQAIDNLADNFNDYAALLRKIKQRVLVAQQRAIYAANEEMLRMYWDIGGMLRQSQDADGWGKKTLQRLSVDLKNDYSEIKGFSVRNMQCMIQFFNEYNQELTMVKGADSSIAQSMIAQLGEYNFSFPIKHLGWTHNLILLQQVKDIRARHWYMVQSITSHWNTRYLQEAIKLDDYGKHGALANNFTETLPVPDTGIGFFFEYDANKKFDLLNAVNEETLVKVIRNGHVQEVPRKDVVVGDIVILETGEEIPADGELLEAVSLQINESNLTGEPVVTKTTVEADFDEEATYASNRVMRGTTVVDGHGVMRVEFVGDATEIGKVARQSTEQSTEPTPLNIQLTKLANLIGKIGFSVAGLAFAIFFIKDVVLVYDFASFHTFEQWLPALKATLQYFMMAVTLIVVAVPEGLPMSVTLSLALNMRRMLSTNNLVRKMHACETMGAITVICTDKTGTLTQNLMQVYEPNFYGLKGGKEIGEDDLSKLVMEGISANSTAFLEETTPEEKPKGVGNPTEVALLLWLNSQQRNYLELREGVKVLDQLTFSTERKFMATLVHSPLIGKKILYVKGAPEIVLGKCKDVLLDGKRVDAVEYRSTVEAQLLNYQNMAMRTLGFAYKIVDDTEPADCVALVAENDLSFLGVVAISDPIRPDVPAAVAKCQSAGIGVKIVTGDTPGTATEIARQIGLWKPEDTERNRITGAAFAELTDEEALDRVLDLKIMSRARPTDKQRLVQLLQQKGAVVAVTGDGTNDAPALNHAQVGLSMGTGTSVAKEASDITLLDDSFNSIGTAVMWGRSLYKNIQRFIVFQLTINFVALFIVLLGSLVGTELPLTVTQMLWVNLIMDTFAALALASIPPSESVMKEKPRKNRKT